MSETKMYCGHCHTCGGFLKKVLDGEEWCEKCGAYRRYQSHGWGSTEDNSPCHAPRDTASHNIGRTIPAEAVYAH